MSDVEREMLEFMKNQAIELEERRQRQFQLDRAHLETGVAILKVQEERNKILKDILTELNRLADRPWGR